MGRIRNCGFLRIFTCTDDVFFSSEIELKSLLKFYNTLIYNFRKLFNIKRNVLSYVRLTSIIIYIYRIVL